MAYSQSFIHLKYLFTSPLCQGTVQGMKDTLVNKKLLAFWWVKTRLNCVPPKKDM